MSGIGSTTTESASRSKAEPRGSGVEQASSTAAPIQADDDRSTAKRISLQRHPHQMPPALALSGSTRRAPAGDEPLFDWERLVPLLVHPAKVAIFEALLWVGRPLSPTELVLVFGDERYFYVSLVAYHVKELVKVGAINRVRTRKVKGARESFYFFPKR